MVEDATILHIHSIHQPMFAFRYAMQAPRCMPRAAAATRAVVDAVLAYYCPVKLVTALVASAC